MSQQSKPNNLQDWRKGLFTKLVPLLSLIPIFAVAITLLHLQITQRQIFEPLAHYAAVNQAQVAIAVQIISGILGATEIIILCALLRLSFSCYASQNKLPLRSLQFAFAVSSQTFTWSLSLMRLSILLGSMAIALLPAAIWSGAITPISVGHNSTNMINAPTFQTSDLASIWNGNNSTKPGLVRNVHTDKGVFSYDQLPLRGLLLHQASEASAVIGEESLHAKLDKTGFVYKNRSYGMGAAAGLIDLPKATSIVRAISYDQEGLKSAVSCYYNTSSAYRLVRWDLSPQFSTYRVQGFYPTGQEYHVPGDTIHSGRYPRDLFSWSAAYSKPERALYLPMASPATRDTDDWRFADFNATQCEIRFTPHTFTVNANYTGKQIWVTQGPEIDWPDFADEVITKVGSWLHSMSYVDGGFGGSQLGRSVRLNVNRLQGSGNGSEAVLMRAIEDHVTSLVDNILVALVSALMVIGKQSAPLEMRVTSPTIKLGEMKFIIGVFAINLVILLLYCLEALRTRFWEKGSDVDMFDLTGLIKGISDGSVVITHDSETDLQNQRSNLWVSIVSDSTSETEKAKLLDRINRGD